MRQFINRMEDALIGILLVLTTLLVFVEVVLRFGFNTGLHWSQELTSILVGWMVLLGASWALRERAHIGVDFLLEKFSSKVRPWIIAAGCMASLTYCVLIGYGGYVYLSKMKLIGLELDDMPVPKWIAYSVMVIGFVLLGYRILEILFNIIRGKDDTFHVHQANDVSKAFDESEEMK
ncbi:TRAP transporter small permease [Alteromonas sp. 1_MG-2023]|uniref:TRAP transporter small permease n=1 Tax=Alteromonas sp. 1_MG-2023 TaxID=3062669 RepID=UPI0026E201A4|nr:TRAP transporter small permease [Alteromonas sp. 1_MG-2023]MDO6474100.1 TRAP transporter small permease [Alteromonas sp. 1_MG-2023]